MIIKSLPEKLSRLIVAGSVGKGRGEKMPSFYLDLAAGREKSEVEYLNGAIVRFAERYQLPAPVNRILTNILVDIVNGKRKWKDFQRSPQTLLTEIKKETIWEIRSFFLYTSGHYLQFFVTVLPFKEFIDRVQRGQTINIQNFQFIQERIGFRE